MSVSALSGRQDAGLSMIGINYIVLSVRVCVCGGGACARAG